MVTTDRVPAIFADARAVHAELLRLLATGDIRDAAEKAWCATKRATDALILVRSGVEPEQSSETTRRLIRLSRVEATVGPLIGRYFTRQGHLHGACFYLGECGPADEVGRRIRETAEYVADAARLADFSSGSR